MTLSAYSGNLSSSPELNGTINPGEENKKSYLTMKEFLQNLQAIQDECIGRIKKQEVGQLPNKIAGASVHSVSNHISYEEWGQMRENISQHSKDWKRFKNDPDKIVLEKNFFINCLNVMQAFYIFRPTNDDGKTYIKINDYFFKSKPKTSQPDLFIIFITSAAILLFSAILTGHIYLYVPGILCICLAFWFSNKKNKAQKIKEAFSW